MIKISTAIIFPSKEKYSVRGKTYNALLEMRRFLTDARVFGPTILKSKLKVKLDSVKDSFSNDLVSKALDDVFGQYFEKKQEIKENNIEMPVNDNDGQNSYSESLSKGVAYTKSNGHFNSSKELRQEY